MKIRFCLEKVEPYMPALLRCLKCQKYEHLKNVENGGQRDLDQMEDCSNENHCSNYQEDCPGLSRFCGMYKKEIMEVKYKSNISFSKA